VKKVALLLALLLVGVASAAPSVVSTTETSASLEGLECGSRYYLEYREYTADGELSSTADSVDAHTKSCPDPEPPSSPQDVAAPGETQPPSSPQDVAATGETQPPTTVSPSAFAETAGVVRCAVPDVRRKAVTKARAMLSAGRCRLGRVTRAYSRKVTNGRIIRQSRRPGARLPRGTRVDVAVSRGCRKKGETCLDSTAR
jgi:PASTA domain